MALCCESGALEGGVTKTSRGKGGLHQHQPRADTFHGTRWKDMVGCLHQHLRILPQHAAQNNNTLARAAVLSSMLSAERNKA